MATFQKLRDCLVLADQQYIEKLRNIAWRYINMGNMETIRGKLDDLYTIKAERYGKCHICGGKIKKYVQEVAIYNDKICHSDCVITRLMYDIVCIAIKKYKVKTEKLYKKMIDSSIRNNYHKSTSLMMCAYFEILLEENILTINEIRCYLTIVALNSRDNKLNL